MANHYEECIAAYCDSLARHTHYSDQELEPFFHSLIIIFRPYKWGRKIKFCQNSTVSPLHRMKCASLLFS